MSKLNCWIRKATHTQAFIKLNKNAPYGQGAGQMNKPLKGKKKKINLSNYCLSPRCGSHARPDRRWQMQGNAEEGGE